MPPGPRSATHSSARNDHVGPAPIDVRVDETLLPPHDPLELYAVLRSYLGQDEVFLLEGSWGARPEDAAAVVGFDRLAELRVHRGEVSFHGAPLVVRELLAASCQVGMVPGPDGARATVTDPEQVWRLLAAAQALFTVHTAIPADRFAFGFLTTLGYGAAWHMERLPEGAQRDESEPDCVLTLFRNTIWYDGDEHGPRLLTAHARQFPLPEPLRIHGAVRTAQVAARAGATQWCPAPAEVRDSTDRDTYLAQVDRCLEHIGLGDIYQIQIGHRIEVTTALRPLQVYRRLRRRNPSPYMYLVPRAGTALIGTSPEVLFDSDGEHLRMRPIAGTRPRSGDPEVDGPRIADLVGDEKERAEHVMLVDLCRNDVGRVCLPGTLEERDLMTVETYSHVFHLVSTVEGRLDPTRDTWDVVRATFPAGTVTGAPKIRAMELIEELENTERGMYAGAVGLVDARGWSRLALCIRTIVHHGPEPDPVDGSVLPPLAREHRYSTRACAGIVADSVPEAEWAETLHKMGAAYWALTGEELQP
ncbi:anthranilate synthase component I family protein [Streptacidiphilus pinicola]|uniref:Anthranilate synthase component I family protein n=2 Tax=Streptacidiphilus pinicola TaxID=2219663 RepID=A0A2X0JX41_9ACTN|nr:anthranilate synthase component I family protein [Streptacidiphilus pinicola]